MKVIGKYNKDIVVKSNDYFIEEASYKQLLELANDQVSENVKIRVMPDYHAGAGNVIGLTMDLNTATMVIPNLIGPDIGCGVALYYFNTKEPLDLEELDRVIRKNVPTDIMNGDLNTPVSRSENRFRSLLGNLKSYNDNLESLYFRSFATLGGGNHFIEVYEIEPLKYGISVHTGSRAVGAAVHKHYNNIAQTFNVDGYIERKKDLIQEMKDDGKEKQIHETLKKITPNYFNMVNSKYRFLSGIEKDNYIHDLKVLNKYTEEHRKEIVNNILKEFDALDVVRVLDKPHNYIGDDNILRKGAQSGKPNEGVLIPINMRDGLIIGTVKNDDELTKEWNYSMPHGAGRLMSRSKAKETLTIEDFEETMKDVFSHSVNPNTLDEAPDAYKSLETILDAVEGSLVDIKVLKPIYNYKGE